MNELSRVRSASSGGSAFIIVGCRSARLYTPHAWHVTDHEEVQRTTSLRGGSRCTTRSPTRRRCIVYGVCVARGPTNGRTACAAALRSVAASRGSRVARAAAETWRVQEKGKRGRRKFRRERAAWYERARRVRRSRAHSRSRISSSIRWHDATARTRTTARTTPSRASSMSASMALSGWDRCRSA